VGCLCTAVDRNLWTAGVIPTSSKFIVDDLNVNGLDPFRSSFLAGLFNARTCPHADISVAWAEVPLEL